MSLRRKTTTLGGEWKLENWPELTDLGFEMTAQSHAFVDLNQDLIGDLCLTMKNKASPVNAMR